MSFHPDMQISGYLPLPVDKGESSLGLERIAVHKVTLGKRKGGVQGNQSCQRCYEVSREGVAVSRAAVSRDRTKGSGRGRDSKVARGLATCRIKKSRNGTGEWGYIYDKEKKRKRKIWIIEAKRL